VVLNAPLELNAAERAEVEAARRGDVAAFNQLVERYQRLAYNVAYRTLGQAEEAADATQEAFLSAFRALPGFRGGAFKAWLLRIVVNCCYDQLRRRQRQPAD
jgi:RNA polymerase sigma-70 factor (ECF subfamily)